MKTNVAEAPTITTHEGGRATRIEAEQELRRSVMACLLWEDSFYESGTSIAARIDRLAGEVSPESVASIAIEARTTMKLRHVPLHLCVRLAHLQRLKADTLATVIQRPDELAEFLALYWKSGRQKLSAPVKRGLARAFTKFSAHSLAKYNRDAKVKLRDVMFLVHPKPTSEEQAATWKKLADKALEPPDTWEVALSRGADKCETWTRLLNDKALGALALLRNLRNMREANVDRALIRSAIAGADCSRVLPFRFIAAARFAPELEPELEAALFRSVEMKLPGHTIVLVDVSGSMNDPLSAKSDMRRIDAACGLAMVAREACASVEVFTFSDRIVQVPARRGFALRDAIDQSQEHSGTYLGRAVGAVVQQPHDRLLVVTDEQAHDDLSAAPTRGYMLNVGTYKNGVGYGRNWTHIDGFSEACLAYIAASENDSTSGHAPNDSPSGRRQAGENEEPERT